MKRLLAFLILASLFYGMMGCGDTSGPTVPAAHVDSIPGFVPLAVGNSWKYYYHLSWGSGHTGYGSIDSGYRRITIASRMDSARIAVYHAQLEDSITSQETSYGTPMGDPQSSVTARMISLAEDSSRIWLLPGTKDDDGMLAACFRSHSFPADSIQKVPGNAYTTPGLPDTVFVAGLTELSGISITMRSEQAQAIGQLHYSKTNLGSFNANGSITPASHLEYRLVEFQLHD